MDRKQLVHGHLKAMAAEVFNFIRDVEPTHADRWVPAAEIKSTLELNLPDVPKSNENPGARGWLFAVLARILEDENLIEYKKIERRAFYRSIKK